MTEIGQNPLPARTCPRCGTELAAGVPLELCPKCLLKTGLEPRPAAGRGGTVALPGVEGTPHGGLPQGGEKVGNYLIIRPLGQGGMGAVFEAEDLESGRRVALKVLSHALDSPEARERFFREGRLAASINHPNSVYIFGTGEIGGTPYIAMELVTGGTLQERVHAVGPLPTSEAVDAVLQIIAGLEAARRIGILHRDVKPSNCYLDAEGTVKIGDFGLSISTAIRTEPGLTASGQFLGTPAFCSPEQLRGEELNVRSDMYSVGVTLYYLLTGRTPFEGKNMVQLLANVLEKRAPSPREFQKTVPQGLAKAVLRCLEKMPGDRFKTYDELRQALAPYGSTAPTPATLGLRFLAGALDVLFLCILTGGVAIAIFGDPMELVNRMAKHSSAITLWMFGGTGLFALYYAVGEGIWGTTLGKAICGLRVVGADNSPPGVPRGLARGLLYVALPIAPYWIFSGGDWLAYYRNPTWQNYALQWCYYVVLALLFCTVRRRNGFAAVHDLVTRTRVVLRAALQVHPGSAAAENPPAAVEGRPLVGPYYVLETLGRSKGMEWVLGYDLRLLRKVWLRVVPPGTPPVPAQWRTLGRAGRLRWLAGRRAPEENWDAFEAVTGQPLVKLAQKPQPWSEVRHWLYDLAGEISVAEKDGSLPLVLELDRVWITGDGRAKLLDFPAPGVEEFHPSFGTAGRSGGAPILPNRFLMNVTAAALDGETPSVSGAEVSIPLPLHARAFLEELPKLGDAAAAKNALKHLLPRLAVVSRLRRAAVVAGCAAIPVLMAIFCIFISAMMKNMIQKSPGVLDLGQLLSLRSVTHRYGHPERTPNDNQYAIFIVAHYHSLITNAAAWNSLMALTMIKGDGRRFAEQSIADHPTPTEKEIAEAETAIKPFWSNAAFPDFTLHPRFLLLAADAGLVFYVVLPSLLAALLFRGGLMLRIANVTYVRRDGRRASRWHVFWRAVVAWSPVGLSVIVCIPLAFKHPTLAQVIAYSLIGGLAIVSAALPRRGLADRLACTWPVPR